MSAATTNTNTKRVILVTGLAGSGKTTLAGAIAKTRGLAVVRADAHRYVSGTWMKLPLAEFAAALGAAIEAAPSNPVVVESVYHDAHDPERAREHVMLSLLPVADAVYVFDDGGLEAQVASLVDRCIRRATGEEPAGAAAETSASRARLLIKAVQNYDANVAALEAFASVARGSATTKVYVGSRDELTRVATAPA